MDINIKRYFSNKTDRSKEAVKNIALSFAAKAVSIICSLMIVSLTINYVNPTQYGIWLTLSSIIGWVHFFDLGIGNGFRNKFAEAKAHGDTIIARKYVSTTYLMISLIVAFVFLVIMSINHFINWSTVLRVNETYSDELSKIFVVISAFFCLNMVVSLLGTLLTADQKPGVGAIIGGLGQVVSLAVIYILTKVSQGSLMKLALYFSGVPCLIWLIASVYMYSSTKYKEYLPKVEYFDKSLIKDILGLGVQFFFIGLAMILVFQIINIVISRELGPEYVTEYNIAYKYFSISHMIIAIIVNPFWSAFTDAYQKKDIVWMKNIKRKLEHIWALSSIAIVLMLAISGIVYKYWIGDEVTIPIQTSVVLAIFFISNNLAATYLNLINGIGYIKIQLIIYIIISVISWPAMTIGGQLFGIVGIVTIPTICVTAQWIFGKIQLEKVLNGTVSGIWSK